MIKEYVGVGPTTSWGAARGSKVAPDSVRLGSAGRQLGKTYHMGVRGGEVTADAARIAGKHPLPISPCWEWFALFVLCQPGPVLALSPNRITDISATPTHRLCTRTKRGMCDDSGNQNLIARAVIEDANMPTPEYNRNL